MVAGLRFGLAQYSNAPLLHHSAGAEFEDEDDDEDENEAHREWHAQWSSRALFIPKRFNGI